MNALPSWADNVEGRALLASIVANPPEHRITLGLWIEGGGRKVYRAWQRPDVAALKRMFKAWWEENYATADALPENADELIERMLNTVGLAELEPKELPNGRFQVAA